jgi:predicted CxxxxCH...CXXCH cytochrome family protein
VLGQTAPTDRHVGAHTKHVGATAMHAPWGCAFCHTNPSTALTPGHVDGSGGIVQAEVRYAPLNPAGTYNAGTATCANLYCHGNGRTSTGTAAWTSTTPLTCTSCHLAPNPGGAAGGMSGEHDKHISDEKMQCVECHQTVVNAARGIIAPALHVNGLRDVKMPQGTWNPANKSCSGLPGGCHGTKSW